MSKTRRMAIVGGVLLLLVGALALTYMPYLPFVHGDQEDEVARLVEWLAVEPGMRIADIGAGDGALAIALAERVGPRGHVFINELSTDALQNIRENAKGLGNVTVVAGTVSSTNLPDGCCDAIYSRNVYHHLTTPDAVNKDIHRSLVAGGRMLVIDFPPGGFLDYISPPDTAERHGGHGTPTDTVVREVTAAGFDKLRGPEPWRGRLYAVLFQRTP